MSTSAENTASEQGNLFSHQEKWYAVDFPGGSVEKFVSFWQTNFPGDSFIVLEGVSKIQLPPFQVRHVALKEIARSLEFLSQGRLAVEVASSVFFNPETARTASLWRIGSGHTEDQALVKMRAVAAPILLQGSQAGERRLGALLTAAKRLEEDRVKLLVVAKEQEGVRSLAGSITSVIPLKEQKVFVLIGGQEGVTGMESFIQAAEQAAQWKY